MPIDIILNQDGQVDKIIDYRNKNDNLLVKTKINIHNRAKSHDPVDTSSSEGFVPVKKYERGRPARRSRLRKKNPSLKYRSKSEHNQKALPYYNDRPFHRSIDDLLHEIDQIEATNKARRLHKQKKLYSSSSSGFSENTTESSKSS